MQGVPIPPAQRPPPPPPAPGRASPPAEGRARTDPAQRQGTPVEGAPDAGAEARASSDAAPRREGTPIRGVPIPGAAPRHEGTPVQGVPRPAPPPASAARAGSGDAPLEEPAAPLAREAGAPEAPIERDRERSAVTFASPRPTATTGMAGAQTKVAPAVPPPPPRPLSQGEATVEPAASDPPTLTTGLRFDDLFRDIGDLPRASHAMAPINLDEQAETRAASELVDLGRYEEAMTSYDEQLRRNPTDRTARAGKELAFGLKLASAGDRAGAIQHLEAALEIEPWSERTARALNTLRRAQTDSRKGLLAKLLGRSS